MVGKRQHFANKYGSYNGDSKDKSNNLNRPKNDDLESGHNENGNANGDHKQNGDARPRPAIFRFKDAASSTVEDQRRDELKEALLHGIDRDQLEKYRKSDDEIKAIKNKKVRKYYEDMNERLNDWLEIDAVVMAVADDVLESMDPDPDRDGVMERGGGIQAVQGHITELLPEEEKEARRKAERRAKLAININVVANIVLVIAKLVASFSSGSLSLIASLVDSALDLLCTMIIWTTNKLVQWRLSTLQKKFPVGRRRLEPLGILVFSIIMVFSFLQILQESGQKLMDLPEKADMLPPVAIGALGATILIKGIIWFGCIPIKTTQVQALAQDCKTDVIFNTLSLLFPLIGHYANASWLDPLGAGILSVFIIFDWGSTCFENVTRLSGQAASDKMLKKLMYLGYRFSPVVDGFKSVTAYHQGDGLWCEFDILLPGDTKLAKAHDISETLQYCAEGLPDVDRAFVTVDYSISGPSGHNTD